MDEFEFLKKILQSSQSRQRTSMHAIAQNVSKNEGLEILKELERNNELTNKKVKELYARVLSLKCDKVETLSPFNPPNSFYVWSASDHGYIYLTTVGRNIKEVVINIMKFILKNCFNASLIRHQYYYLIKNNDEKIGKLSFMKRDYNRNECLVAKIDKNKILMHFDNYGLLIRIKIYCPEKIKKIMLDKFLELEEQFNNLCN
ncbi:MAG: hypothetical protein GF329_01415 [Candidatus Lokiarchaeota archaeon]|nr:hypothetical protein [Candidatus Lokiarchaeota archaeon]